MNEPESSEVFVSSEMLENQSKIFGFKNPSMVLTDYQKAIDRASLELCKANVALLEKRRGLLEKARKKVDEEGYHYKKNSSQSTIFGSESSTEWKAKRKYVQSDCRDEEIPGYKESLSASGGDDTEIIVSSDSESEDERKQVLSYKIDKAINCLMQLPIVVLKIKGILCFGACKSDRLFSNLIPDKSVHVGLDRESLKVLCNLASSETDRKLLKTVATAGLSAEKAKALFGISNLHKLRNDVAQAVQEVGGFLLNDIDTQNFNNLTTTFFNELMCKTDLHADHLKLVIELRQTYSESVIAMGETMPSGFAQTESESED
ncbi:Hypothetical predicted protein [Paramuricea clavata]|uniref:Uncharacterized protein n=1 Tax=Paramuricea clavata TaxID=317549 RepID=A0A7D9I714_PARCT|nr:Hypothetical predicted protein [Paramuricea clavata]